jgi:4-alpha-glucanotransferase
MDDLAAAARRWGVEPGYHDVFGHRHDVPVATLRTVMEALSKARSGPADLGAPALTERAFQGDGRKVWGLAVQLYAVRSRRNWGIGDFKDLGAVIDISAAMGASAIGLNPLHALFLDRAEAASPYGPNSRMFLNPLYIAVDAVAEYRRDASTEEKVQALREPAFVDYKKVAALKMTALRAAYDRFLKADDKDRQRDFDGFRSEWGDSLQRFACFEVLRSHHGALPWWKWPPPWSAPEPENITQFHQTEAYECGFVEYLQWIADRQLGQCRDEAAQKGLPIGLYLDLAVGVDPAGADAWSNQAAVLAGLSIGAPPDEFNPVGQNWGLAPFNPHALPDQDFALLRRLLSASMRHGGALRLDHVLGLMRLYVIPYGASAKEGAYVRFPFERLLRVIAEESNKHRCIFIGEDLGTVPDGFRETAARWGVWTYRVMMFERWQNGEFKLPSEYPMEALASFNTHDLPTFRGWMTGADLATKCHIGIDPGESEEARHRARSEMRHRLTEFAGVNSTENFAAAAGFLAATPCRLVMVAIEDMLDVIEQVNIPGTVEQHPNWRRKLPFSLEEWEAQPTFRAVRAAFDYTGRSVHKR